jgi:predicted transcriptional regulator
MHINKEKTKLKYLLGTYLKEKKYKSNEDIIYDVIKYMDEKQISSITSSSLHYALNFKVSNEYLEEVMEKAIEDKIFIVDQTSKKKTYTLKSSPFL